MDKENFYIDILSNLNSDLKQVVSKQDQYQASIYNTILAGVIIRLSTIIDQFMFDFHSEEFDYVANVINNARQELIHYSDFTNLQDLTNVAEDISYLLDEVCEHEKNYFYRVLNDKKDVQHNVIVASSKNINYEKATDSYVFSTEDATISISADKIIKIKDSGNQKDVQYIVNCDSDMNCFYVEDGQFVYQQLNAPEQLKDFFKLHFKVEDEDYTEYLDVIEELTSRFYRKGNYGIIYVSPKDKPSQKKKIGKVLNAYYNKGVLYKDLLTNLDYATIKVPVDSFFNYKQIRNNCCKDLEKAMSKRDYFFIYKAISGLDNINKKLSENEKLPEKEYKYLQSMLLVGWADTMVRTMRPEFVEVNKDFKQLYDKIVEYRTFFAHNPWQFKQETYKQMLDEFHELAKGYVSVISGLEIATFKDQEDKKLIDFVSVKRDITKFYTDRTNQYVEVDPTTYIGNRLFFANLVDDCQSRVALVPVTSNYAARGGYYEKKGSMFAPKTFHKKHIMVSKLNYKTGKEETIDINMEDVLYLFCAYKGKIEDIPASVNTCKKLLLFNPSERNGQTLHAAYLENVIHDYFYKKQLPYELAQLTSIKKELNWRDELELTIVDSEGNEIAKVIDKYELEKYNIPSDNKRFGHGK